MIEVLLVLREPQIGNHRNRRRLLRSIRKVQREEQKFGEWDRRRKIGQPLALSSLVVQPFLQSVLLVFVYSMKMMCRLVSVPAL